MVFWQLTIDANDPRCWRVLEDPIYFVVMHDAEGNEFCVS
jgi:hypothetical protein